MACFCPITMQLWSESLRQIIFLQISIRLWSIKIRRVPSSVLSLLTSFFTAPFDCSSHRVLLQFPCSKKQRHNDNHVFSVLFRKANVYLTALVPEIYILCFTFCQYKIWGIWRHKIQQIIGWLTICQLCILFIKLFLAFLCKLDNVLLRTLIFLVCLLLIN